MRLRNIPEAKDVVAASPYVVHDPMSHRGKWKTETGKPLYVEIGMGKGRFIIETACAHPEHDYIGIERYESVLFRACERMAGIPYHTPADQLERRKSPEQDPELMIPANLRFISIDAKYIADIFDAGEVDGIFLNFSDPWPKARHAKRRLTSGTFLALYEKILKDGGTLEFKTDNQDLFTFSLEEIRESAHWELLASTRDLHRDPVLGKDNVMTEYERKFSKLGNPICKMIAVFHA